MTDRDIKNARILEAFSLIDEKYIGEVASSLKLDDFSEAPPKPSIWKSLKPVLALVACALLIGALFPIVSYLIRLGGFNPGVNPSEIGEGSSSRVIKTGYQVYGGEVYNERIGRMVRYLPATDEYESLCDHKTCPEGCYFRSIECLSQIVDGKLYYIYDSVWGSDQDIRAAYLDLSTMESVDIGDISAYSITGRAYVYDGYYYFSRKINLPRNRTELYRIPIAGGSEELVLEFDGEGSLFMVADGEIITTNRYDYLLDPPPLVIKAYNIETGAERVLWSRDDGEDIRVLEPAFLDGKLYFLASADEGNDLIRVDLESGEEECVQSGLSDRYWLMNDGVYYFRFEVRTINYRSPISSLIGDDRVADSASLYYYGFDEKKETVVYKNEDIAPCYPSGMVIAGTKVCGYFCGNFPALGLERAKVLISIDLESGEITALDETGLQSVTEDETTETNYLDGLKIDYPGSSYPLYGPAFVLSYEEVYEIISNYLKDDADLTYTYSVRCYMKADGAYAVMIDSSGWLYTQELRHVDVAGYTFLFPDGQRMYIYKDGEFYTLLEAYQNGVVSRDYIASIIWSKSK